MALEDDERNEDKGRIVYCVSTVISTLPDPVVRCHVSQMYAVGLSV